MRHALIRLGTLTGLVLAVSTHAGEERFSTGPVFEAYGENAPIQSGISNPVEQRFKVAFDVYKVNEGEKVSRSFNSIARFINMHVRAGVPKENIQAAIVVHGKASTQLLTGDSYQARFGSENGTQELLEQLLDAGVTIALCGQSAAYYDVAAEDLLPGVKMSLSAMTEHALLQQQGFSLNPF